MPSFTSPSKSRVPWRAVWLLALGLASLGLAALYTLRWNPEVRFYTHAVAVKHAWAEKLRASHGHVVVVCGASSCAFSIDGERMRSRFGLPVVNFGLHAGMEPLFISGAAVDVARAGDTLVVALEPGLLMVPFNSPDLAAQMGFALGQPGLIHATSITGDPVHWVEDLLSLRPGAYHFFTLVGKVMLRKPLYRYSPEDVQPSGWQKTKERREFPDQEILQGTLSADARKLLLALKQWGQAHQVEVVYSLPWGYATAARLSAFQAMNSRFLHEVGAILPVLKDPALGAYTNRAHYADTEWHLTEEGAAARSDSLATQLLAHSFWTPAELDALASAR